MSFEYWKSLPSTSFENGDTLFIYPISLSLSLNTKKKVKNTTTRLSIRVGKLRIKLERISNAEFPSFVIKDWIIPPTSVENCSEANNDGKIPLSIDVKLVFWAFK